VSRAADHRAGAERPVRITPLPESDRSARQQELLDDLVRGPTVNIYATVVRHPHLAEAMFHLGRNLRRRSLPERHREILILRTGCNCDSGYELAQHYRVATEIGMTAEDMTRIRLGPNADSWDPFEAALCRAADELHSEHTIRDDTWSVLAAAYDEPQLIQVTALVGYYHVVSFLLNTLGVPLEEGIQPFPTG
jgi:alkylhydroperoxidase family enzyme